MTFLIIFLIVWTLVSLYHFFSLLGEKYRKEPWYDKFLLPPAIAVIFLVVWTEQIVMGFISKVKSNQDKG